MLVGRLAASLRPGPPRCLFCPGTASGGWMIDPLGHVHGVCLHCLERTRQESEGVAGLGSLRQFDGS